MPSGQVKVDILLAGSDKLSAVISKTQKNIKKFGAGANKAGQTAKNAFGKFGKAAKSVKDNITQIHSGIFVMKSAVAGLGKVWSAVKSGEEAANIAESFRQTVDATGSALNLFKKATLMTVDDTTLQRMAVQFRTVGLSIKQTGEIFELAKKQSLLQGKSFDRTAKKVMVAVSEGSVGQLAQLGVQVDLNEAYEKFAKTLNKGVKDLNAWEKHTARVTENLFQLKTNSKLAEIDTTQFLGAASELTTDYANIVSDLEVEVASLFETLADGGDLAVSSTQRVQQAFIDLSKGTGDLRGHMGMLRQAYSMTDEEAEKMLEIGNKMKEQKREMAGRRFGSGFFSGIGEAIHGTAEETGFSDTMIGGMMGLGMRDETQAMQDAEINAAKEMEAEMVAIRDRATEAERQRLFEEKAIAAERKKLLSDDQAFHYEILAMMEAEANQSKENSRKNLVVMFQTLKDMTEKNPLKDWKNTRGEMITQEETFGKINDVVMRKSLFWNLELGETFLDVAAAMASLRAQEEGWGTDLSSYTKEQLGQFRKWTNEFKDQHSNVIESTKDYRDLNYAIKELNEGGEKAAAISRDEMKLRFETDAKKKQALRENIARNKVEIEHLNMIKIKTVFTAKLAVLTEKLAKAQADANMEDILDFGKAIVKLKSDLAGAKEFDYHKALAQAMKALRKTTKSAGGLNKELKKTNDEIERQLGWLDLRQKAAKKDNAENQKSLANMEHELKLKKLLAKEDSEIGKIQKIPFNKRTKKQREKVAKVRKEITLELAKLNAETSEKISGIESAMIDTQISVEELKIKKRFMLRREAIAQTIENFTAIEEIEKTFNLDREKLKAESNLRIERLDADLAKGSLTLKEHALKREIEIAETKSAINQSQIEEERQLSEERNAHLLRFHDNLQFGMQGISDYSANLGQAMSGMGEIVSLLSDNTRDMQTNSRLAISAGGRMFASMQKDTRKQAAIRGAFEFAAGWAAYPDPAGMTSHFLASTLFFAMAGQKKTKGGAGGGAMPKAGSFGGGGASKGMGSVNTQSNITVNVAGFAVGSASQMGKAIGDAVGEFDGAHSGRV